MIMATLKLFYVYGIIVPVGKYTDTGGSQSSHCQRRKYREDKKEPYSGRLELKVSRETPDLKTQKTSPIHSPPSSFPSPFG